MPKLGKAARVAERKTEKNKPLRSRAKTRIDSVEEAVASKDLERALNLYKEAQSALDKGVRKQVLKKNNAARRNSRLIKKINALRPQTAGSKQ